MRRLVAAVALAVVTLLANALPADAAESHAWTSGRNMYGYVTGTYRYYKVSGICKSGGQSKIIYGVRATNGGVSSASCPSGWTATSAWILWV